MRDVILRFPLVLALLLPLLATDARAEEGDREAWRAALAPLVGRIVQYGTVIEGRYTRVLARVQSVLPSEDDGMNLAGLRIAEAPGEDGGALCREEVLVAGILDLQVLDGGMLVAFGSTLAPELRKRLALPAEPEARPPPPASEVDALEKCARRATQSPIRSLTVHLRRGRPPSIGAPSEAAKPFDVEYGFDGAVHSLQEELGEDWSELGFTVVMRSGFRADDLTIENSNVTVMHCSDEGGWTTLDFKKGTTPWLALKRTGNEHLVGAVRVAPFPRYTKSELDAANRQGYTDCSPTLGARQYRLRYKGKTLKTIVVTPALGC
jgi:hypothetical protein